jgi:hypothetical protein
MRYKHSTRIDADVKQDQRLRNQAKPTRYYGTTCSRTLIINSTRERKEHNANYFNVLRDIKKHHVTHNHADYQGKVAVYFILDGTLLAGVLPPNKNSDSL